jgi:hypothetical protein
MSSVWILVYIIPLIVGVVAAGYFLVSVMNIFSTIDFSDPQWYYYYSYDWMPEEFISVYLVVLLIGLANSVISLVLIYLLVNRRGTHFKRQKLLSEDIIATLGSLAKTKEIDVDVSLSSLERTVKEANYEENERSPILWAILSVFVPFVLLYVYYFLVKDFLRHERREDRFWEDVSTALNQLGVNFSVPKRTEAMPARSFVLYLILTIVTSSFFMVYWLYALLKDPTEHFKQHKNVENQLLTALESAAA